MTQSNLNIADNYADLCEKVSQEILNFSNERIAARKKFSMVLSGGSTPKGIYQCMSGPSYRDKFQWDKMHFFWSDERWVAVEDEKSNHRMVSEMLFTGVHVPSENIHPIQTQGCTLEESAHLYEEVMSDFFKLKRDEFPHFDLVLLGLGLDGHTASLFPGNPGLLIKDRSVIAVSQKGIPEQRVTLSFPAINHAEKIFLLVSGLEKAQILHEVLEGKHKDDFPAHHVRPHQGTLYWFMDKAAATELGTKNV